MAKYGHPTHIGSTCMAYAVLDKMDCGERKKLQDAATRKGTPYWAEELVLKARVNELVHRDFYGANPYADSYDFQMRMENAACSMIYEFVEWGREPSVEDLALIYQIFKEMLDGHYPSPDTYM